jgi:hypothetical protein
MAPAAIPTSTSTPTTIRTQPNISNRRFVISTNETTLPPEITANTEITAITEITTATRNGNLTTCAPARNESGSPFFNLNYIEDILQKDVPKGTSIAFRIDRLDLIKLTLFSCFCSHSGDGRFFCGDRRVSAFVSFLPNSE